MAGLALHLGNLAGGVLTTKDLGVLGGCDASRDHVAIIAKLLVGELVTSLPLATGAFDTSGKRGRCAVLRLLVPLVRRRRMPSPTLHGEIARRYCPKRRGPGCCWAGQPLCLGSLVISRGIVTASGSLC